jgi:tetratricopeptide (TPR) repeat protein
MADPPEFDQFSDWDLLLRHLRFSEGFSLSFLTVPDRIAERECIERLSEWANGQTRPLILRSFETAGELTSLASWLVELDSCEPASIIAGAASVPLGLVEGPDWKVAWTQGLSWLNQYRNLVQQRHPCALLLIGPEYLLRVAREAAPDLWSVRAVCASMTPAPSDSVSVSGFQYPNALSMHAGLAIDPEFALREARRLMGRPQAGSDTAFFLHRAALGFAARNRHNEALAASQESVSIYRSHAATRSFAHIADLAMALNNLSNHLSEVGRWKEALEAILEAVEIRRTLAVTNPQAFLPDLASSLNNQSICLSLLGRPEDAYEACREATSVFRALAVDRPDDFRMALALSLNTLSNCLSELGKRQEAYEAIREAVEICRAQPPKSPEPFRLNLTNLLNTLSNRLGQLARWEEADAVARESVDLCRELDEERPGSFLPHLASSLHNLSKSSSRVGRWEEALDSIREAVEIRRRLATESPERFRRDLASSLTSLSTTLIGLGRREEAYENIRESVEIGRTFAAEPQVAASTDLPRSLGVLNNAFDSLGRHQEAAEACREALEVLWPSFEQIPAAHGPLAFALIKDYLSQCLKSEAHPDVALVERYVKRLEPMIAEGGTAEGSL